MYKYVLKINKITKKWWKNALKMENSEKCKIKVSLLKYLSYTLLMHFYMHCSRESKKICTMHWNPGPFYNKYK